MKRLTVVVFCCIALASGCAPGEKAEDGLTPEQIASEVTAAMDLTADPCQDFYRYACGGWLENTEMPSDQARWSRSFSVIHERNREVIRTLLEDAAADPGDDPTRQRIGLFYGTCMNEEAVESRGAAPLHPLFQRIEEVQDVSGLFALTGELHRSSINVLFGGFVVPDFQNPDLNIVFLAQGGLGMPDRDYYVSDDPTKRELLADYEKHVARMFGLLGDDEATAAERAGHVLALETALAEISRDRTAMRDFARLYNKIDIGGLKELTPELPWDTYLAATGYPDIVDISVATPEFFEFLQVYLAEIDPEILRSYLRWHVVDSTANVLSSEFVNANFDFFGRKLAGQEEIKPRWKRCVAATEGALGESLGKLYVEKMFSGSSKDVALEMIGDIETAFAGFLPGLTWMDDVTRERATEKLEAVSNKIGYPDVWRDYSGLEISAEGYFENTMASREFEFDYETRKIGKPVDRNEWGMTPQMVNAYNNPLWNEIVFPAGILQPPFFHRDFPAAMNYGGIGGVIGHELTHGYDDQGRKFDPQGRMQEWWEPEVAERFVEASQCVEEFYSDYEIEPGVSVNGALTLGENIADIGGLKQSYEAYRLWEARHGAPEPTIEGLTNEQLVFVNWGQVWCTLQSDEATRLQVTTDPHSPARFRVNGPVSHIPAFAEAFQCEVGTPMRPEEQCVVW
jgi:predicted metalloendopeptidase